MAFLKNVEVTLEKAKKISDPVKQLDLVFREHRGMCMIPAHLLTQEQLDDWRIFFGLKLVPKRKDGSKRRRCSLYG
jgi:hypothetical protein